MMNGKLKTGRFPKAFLFVCMALLCSIFFAVTVFADTGPKPQITIKVTNPPDELYYLDLVEEDQGDKDSLYENLDKDKTDTINPEMLKNLLNSVPDGWHACLAEGTYGPMWGSLVCDKQSNGIYVHDFSYVGTPHAFCILVVTKSGETWISNTLNRSAFQQSYTLDWKTRTVRTPEVGFAYLMQFLATFIPTLLIEFIVLFLFRYSWKKSWKPFLSTNLITQGALTFYFAIDTVRNGLGWNYYISLVPAEILIMVVECIIYSMTLKEHSKRRAVLYGITANVCSLVVGGMIAGPVWNFVVSVS